MYIEYKQTIKKEIKELKDLPELRKIMENLKMKPNFSKLARELNKDYRTIKRYYYEGMPSKTRNKKSKLDEFKPILNDLLLNEDNIQYFSNKKVLWQYLVDNENLSVSYSTLKAYLYKHPEYNNYFTDFKKKLTKHGVLRVESKPGEQAQIDWKENIKFITKDGEVIYINVFGMVMSYSRFRMYHLTLSKTQDILLNTLVNFFESLGGIPHEIYVDNMKTVMDEPRTRVSKGKINTKFLEFSKDMGFKVKPCVAYSPQTKGKVESIMKSLNELMAYNGKLDLNELRQFIQKLADRYNLQVHGTIGVIPFFELSKEKDFLLPLPHEKVRNHYKISTSQVKINKSAMFSYKGKMYSVSPEYINKHLNLQVHDGYLYLYDNMKLVVSHAISNKNLNYNSDHYISISKDTWVSKNSSDIYRQAKNNLKNLEDRFND